MRSTVVNAVSTSPCGALSSYLAHVTKLRRIAVIVGCAALAAACGSSGGHSTTVTHVATPVWSGLTRVSVHVDQPSVQTPPGTKILPTTFTTPAQLTAVTKALNANHIRKAQHTTTSNGCTGGIQIAITVTQPHGQTDLNAYHCANTVTGNIAGDLMGFLRQIGVGTA